MNDRDSRRPTRSRIVVDASARQYPRRPATQSRYTELWVGLSVILAAALATFVALFITSRPYDPMDASVAPQQVVPQGPLLTASPKPTGSPTPQYKPTTESSPSTGGGDTSTAPPNDAAIQSGIERALGSDPTLSGADVSTLVEGGKVTVVGSVSSVELKRRVESVIRSVKGVSGVDNQLVITQATPS